MENNNETIPTFKLESPSVSDQIVTAAVGVGVSLAVTAVFFGAITTIGAVKTRLDVRKARKEAKTITD